MHAHAHARHTIPSVRTPYSLLETPNFFPSTSTSQHLYIPQLTTPHLKHHHPIPAKPKSTPTNPQPTTQNLEEKNPDRRVYVYVHDMEVLLNRVSPPNPTTHILSSPLLLTWVF
ncbi:hypothetical protein BO71DRAFT_400410 [Aspergillus ellipticus CBS 707.79]|uniref:Uncharacterized protein n=1 Tax=Aspergillus ellipticus CBS 707.79 TaxID=1448320 RepID=A0A319DED2_9EURO|nr:hypothetical protein BO71DRAFT_400410 [Aspergillus ellipticus CBS 707.79]